MGEILGLGISHFPGFIYNDSDMSMRIKQTLTSPKVPEHLKDPANWPAEMRREWADDEGTAFASRHRAEFVDGVRKLRSALDEFKPDVVVIFGDDQYENFKEDIIPPFCVFIQDEFHTQPYMNGPRAASARAGGKAPPNVWEEPDDMWYTTPGHREAAKYLTTELLKSDFDMPYSYKLLHHEGLGHAFMYTQLYLDYDRTGWDYPIVPIAVNAYGRNIIRGKGMSGALFTSGEAEYDPPGPSPKRCFELGQNVARILRDSPWRAAIIGSSSWSHAFLTDKNSWIYPDVATDKDRFAELKAGNYTAWRDLKSEDLEASGENELLNWIPLAGAMHELNQKPSYCEFIESYLMNSCKCVALFPPK
jgi:hypothetical protein